MYPAPSSGNVMLPNTKSIQRTLILVIIVSVAIRGFLAWALELGNDEVYYWTYALFPGLSHFDHPPMVGFMIQLFSLNLYFDNELFIRMGSVLLGGVNTWLIFLIGKQVKNELTGLFAAMFYNTSVYCFVIAGIFILPDTPQLFFWLAGLYFLITSLPAKEISKQAKNRILIAGLLIGLAMLSKYTSVFLWLGAGLYILIYNRKWLKTGQLYLAVVFSLVVFTPALLWNLENKFISFTFQSERVGFFGQGIRIDYFFTELLGQALYNNPVNFLIIIVALFALWKKKFSIDTSKLRILLFTSLPLIFLFLFFALFRRTLPHWTGPAYLGLILIAAAWLAEKAGNKIKPILFPKPILISAIVLIITLSLGFIHIKWGIFSKPNYENPEKLGENDITLDMYGWRQFADKFSQQLSDDVESGKISADAPIISHRWFPAAHLDYYVAHPKNKDLLVIGDLERIHKYAWINREREPVHLGSDAYFITSSRDFQNPEPLFSKYFTTIENPQIIEIFKGNKHVENFFVYRMHDCYKVPEDILKDYGIGGYSH
jgi:hypothetical protein